MTESEDRVRGLLARAGVKDEPGDLALVARFADGAPVTPDPKPTTEPALVLPVSEWPAR